MTAPFTSPAYEQPPMSPVLIVLLLLVLVPLAEVGVFITVGGVLGLWPTLALTVLTAVIGTLCIRLQGFSLINEARTQFEAGAAPVFELISGACLVVAGVLLLMPGFVTDAAGFLLLLPPVRRLMFDKVIRPRLNGYSQADLGRAERQQPAGEARGEPARPVIIEGEFEEMGEIKGEMPPPRGSWNKRS